MLKILKRRKIPSTTEADYIYRITIETSEQVATPGEEPGGWRFTYNMIPSSNVETIYLDPTETTVEIGLKKNKEYEITACRLDTLNNPIGVTIVDTIETPK